MWVVYGLLAMMAVSALPLISEYSRVKATQVIFWWRAAACLFCVPFLTSVNWPSDPKFYLLVLLNAPLALLCDLGMMRCASKQGAGVTSRIIPLSALIAFFVWPIIDSTTLQNYLEQPVRTAIICCAVFGAISFAIRLRRCEINRSALKDLYIVIVLGGMIPVIGKLCLNYADEDGPFCYTALQCIIIMLCWLCLFRLPWFERWLGNPDIILNVTFRAKLIGALCGFFWILGSLFKYHGYRLAENPAYISVILLLSPLFVILVYRYLKHQEEGNVKDGLGIALCAGLLVLATNY